MPTKRQNAIISALPTGCGTLLDVGCDHGRVGAAALQRGLAERVVFIDISEKCLNKARAECAKLKSNAKSTAEFVRQDGIGNLRCDCAVVAGMGGRQILEILSAAEALPQKLVLQPMKNMPELRARLCEKYAFISDEITECAGKFYDIIVLERGQDTLSDAEVLLGRTNLAAPSPQFVRYLQRKEKKLAAILTKSPRNTQARHTLSLVRGALQKAANNQEKGKAE